MDEKRFNRLFDSVQIVQGRREFFWLVNKVEQLNPHVIIEIGVLYGGTLKFWEQLVNSGDLVIGIDKNPMITWDINRSDRRVVIVTGDSLEQETVQRVGTILGERRADFLFINGQHGLYTVTSDLQNYSKFVRRGGIIGFHDLYTDRGDPKKVFDKLEGKKEECHCNGEQGTGVWWKT